MLLPSCITTVLLIKVGKELRQMKQRMAACAEDIELRSATKYVIITCAMFYCALIPGSRGFIYLG